MKKTIITEFFTTVSFGHFLISLSFFTFKFPFFRKGNSIQALETALLKYLEKHHLKANISNNFEDRKILSFYN
jgi:hypothetical protein